MITSKTSSSAISDKKLVERAITSAVVEVREEGLVTKKKMFSYIEVYTQFDKLILCLRPQNQACILI